MRRDRDHGPELLQKSGAGDFPPDAASLARLHRASELTAVWVPDAELKSLITRMHVSRGGATLPPISGDLRQQSVGSGQIMSLSVSRGQQEASGLPRASNRAWTDTPARAQKPRAGGEW